MVQKKGEPKSTLKMLNNTLEGLKSVKATTHYKVEISPRYLQRY